MPSFTVISISAEEDPRLLFFNVYVICAINSDHLFILKVICWHLYRVSSGSKNVFHFPASEEFDSFSVV